MYKYSFTENDVQNFFDHYYVDRGVMKWQGFMLSDHIAALNNEKMESLTPNKVRPQMSREKISDAINTAIVKHKKISVQINEIDVDGNHTKEVSGYVEGSFEDNLCLNDSVFFSIDSIRSIRLGE